MIAKTKNLIILCLLLVAAIVIARDYGRYKCPACTPTMNPVDVRAFIGVFVNPNVNMWAANDTVSICNGSTCTQYVTPNQGSVWSPRLQYPDPGIDYKGEGQPIADGGGLDPNPNGPIVPIFSAPIEAALMGYVAVGNIYPDGFFLDNIICHITSDSGYDGC